MQAVDVSDWYEAACRRAKASRRRKTEATEWPDFAPPVALSGGPLGGVQAADREIARQTALRARAVADFAASRPATADRAQGEPGAMSPERWAARPEALRSVSEWAAAELVVALSISTEAAEKLLERSLMLVHRLPGTLAALEAGALHPGHLWPMLEKVAPIEENRVRAEIEASLLRWAAGRVTTPGQLGAKARREVLRRDARAAVRQLEAAIRERGIHLRPGATDGMATVTALLTVPEAQLLLAALGAYADAVADDPQSPRTRGQKMADCLLDLVLRPGEADAPTVQLLLTVVASVGTLAGGDEPGEIDGHVVPAETIRDLLGRIVGRPPTTESGQAVADEPDEPDEPDDVIADARAAGGNLRPAEGPLPIESVEENGRLPIDPAGTDDPLPIDPTYGGAPPWQQVEQGELEQWWAEMERRVLADEWGAGSDPWPPVVGPPTPSDIGGPDPGPPEAVPVDETGWWVSADRAVDEAGQALRRAGQALTHAQRLVRTASMADTADEAAWRAGAGGGVSHADNSLDALRACTDGQRQWLAELLATTGGGGLAQRPRIALTDALSGTLLALTDLPEMRRVGTCGARLCRRDPARCAHDLTGRPGLGPPGPTDDYRPSAPLDRWVRARDRRCRFPGCRRRVPRGGELDHDRPYPLGPTSAANLAGYCTGHHRGKHQAPGWRHALAPDGTLTVTTPTGLTVLTTPPPY